MNSSSVGHRAGRLLLIVLLLAFFILAGWFFFFRANIAGVGEVLEDSNLDGIGTISQIEDKDIASVLLAQKNTIDEQAQSIAQLQQDQSSILATLNSIGADGKGLKFFNNIFKLALDGTTLSQSKSGLKVSDEFYNDHVRSTTQSGGDVTGVFGAIQINNDSHDHTGSTISGLSVADFTSQGLSQWTNDAGYLTGATAFVQGGNSFGSLAQIGTNDGYGLAFETGNTEAMRILANGDVGIGTTAPTAQLTVNDCLTSAGLVASFTRNSKTLGLYSNSTSFNVGTETNHGLGFYTNQSSAQMMLDTSGRLGIGTTSPGARLEINSGVVGNPGLKFTQLTSSMATSFSNGKVLTVDASGNLTWAVDQVGLSPEALPSGTLGQTLYNNGVSWVATSNLYNTGGRVGIGTTNPQDMLHIYGTDNAPGDGVSPQKNGIVIDGVADGDKSLTFADAGVNKWAFQTYRNEAGEFMYLYNYETQKEPLVVSNTGRVGINNPSNIMSYHALHNGAGEEYDVDIGGVFSGNQQHYYYFEIDSNGVPDTFRWKTSLDNLNWSDWTSNVAITGDAQSLDHDITITFAATTGHTLGDSWTFTAFPQLPRAALSVGPGGFDEVLLWNGSSYTDDTYNANITAGVAETFLSDTNNYLYLGRAVKTNSIYLILDQPAVGADLVVEYWNGASWVPITVADHQLYDQTYDLTETGSISFDKSLMTGWAKGTVSDYVDLYYWLRLRTSSTPTTAPQYHSVSPGAKNRLGIYAASLDADPIFSVDAIGHTNVGDGLNVTGIAEFASVIKAAGGVEVGVGQGYTGLGAVALTSANGTALTMDSGTTGAINIGTGANAKTITIGNATTTTGVVINTGTGDLNLNPTLNDTHISGGYGATGVTVSNLGGIQANGALTVDGASTLTGLVTASAGISIGSAQSYTGAGVVTLSSATGSALNVVSGGTGALTLDSGTTGAINLGTGANAKTITIGNNTGSTALSLVAGSSSISVNNTSINFLTNSSTALTLNTSGDATLTGNLTITGDKLFMGSNVVGSVLVADGTNFNSVVMSGDATIAANGALAINYIAAQSADGSTKGFLTAADWTTFFNKQAALGYTAEDAANKSTDINIDGASNTKYASAKAVKDYADNLALGLNWKDPSELINVVGDSASPIGSPSNLDGYIILTGGNTGAWSTFAAGDLVQYQGSSWVKIKSMAVGDHFGVAYKSSTTPMGGMTGKKNYLAQVTGGSSGAFTYTFTAPSNNDAVYVQNVNAYYHNVSFVYSSSLSEWVQLSAAVDYSFGSGLQTTGTVVSLGNLVSDWNQAGAFNINTAGNIGLNGGSLTTTATTANLFNTNATTLNIGSAASAIKIGSDGAVLSGNGALSINSADTTALTVDSGTTGGLNIGTSASAKTITIGNTTGATSLTLRSGSGNISINPASNDTLISGGYGSTGLTIASDGNLSTNGTLTIDGVSTLTGLVTASAGISIGSGQSYTGAGAVSVNSAAGTALTLDSGTTGALNIGTGANAKIITIGSSSSSSVKVAKLTTQYGVLYTGTTDGALAQTAAGTTGQCLIGNTGGAPTWGSCVTGAAFTKTGTNIAPTTAGDDLVLGSGETLTIGGGTAITKHLSASATLDFNSIPNNSCLSMTVTVTGAVVGDSVSASPSAVASGIETFANTSWNAYVSAADTVTVRECKINTGTVNPAAQAWRVDVWQH